MNYTRKSFTVAAPMSDAYSEGWERTFGRRDVAPVPQEQVEVVEVPVSTLQEWAAALALGQREGACLVRDDILELIDSESKP